MVLTLYHYGFQAYFRAGKLDNLRIHSVIHFER